MKKSASLFRQAERLLAGGVNSPVRAFRAVGGRPVFLTRGRGSRVWDADGRSYIDYLGSWGPLILGHAPAAVVRAAQAAVQNGSSFGAPCELEIRLARLIRDAFPSMERMRFVSSGTEACMSALRLARGCTGRPRIVKFSGCYHGHSDGLLVAAGSGATTFGHPASAGVPPEFVRLTMVLPYNDTARFEEALKKWGRRIAAVILEPVAGNMGVVVPDRAFLTAVHRLTRKYGILLIFDEVITGFRLEWGGAQARFGIKPDLTCLGKIVGGGFPVGVFGGPRKIMNRLAPLGPVYQAGTLSGNPVAMAAGTATLSNLSPKRPYDHLERLTFLLVNGIRSWAVRTGHAVTINSIGSMFTVFFTENPVTNYATALRADTKKYGRFFRGLLSQGIYFPPAQFEAAFVSAAHSKGDIQRTLKVVERVFRSL